MTTAEGGVLIWHVDLVEEKCDSYLVKHPGCATLPCVDERREVRKTRPATSANFVVHEPALGNTPQLNGKSTHHDGKTPHVIFTSAIMA